MMSTDRIERIISGLRPDKLALLLVAVGPVQDFIAEARKTRDLWVGSYLLSKAAFEAMLVILDKYGEDAIIMPSLSESVLYQKWRNGKGSTFSIDPSSAMYATLPNHFLAVVPDSKVQDIAKEIKEKVEGTDKVEGFLRSLGIGLKEEINGITGEFYSTWDDLWDFQLSDHFRLMWVSIQVAEDELKNGYQSKHSEIQKFMEERKITRIFEAWQGNKVVKCGQCGHREVVGPPEFDKNREFWNLLRKKGRTRYSLNRTERLCAVCLVKRLVEEGKLFAEMPKISFDSTSDIASGPFRRKLVEYKGDNVVMDFVEGVKALGEIGGISIAKVIDIPGDWFFKESLGHKRIVRDHSWDDKDNKVAELAETAKKRLEEVYRYLECKPSKYYAILIMDGDNMGKYLSGEKIPHDHTFSMEWQAGESAKLASLASHEWPEIVEKWGGRIIYAGGDDILVFGPLEGALRAAAGLRGSFLKEINTTISGGLVIAHHNDSMRRALVEARSALASAKDRYGRDALAITLRMSSGMAYTCGCRWEIEPDCSFPEDFMGALIRWMRIKRTGLSPAFIYDLLMVMDGFYWFDHRNKMHLKLPDMLATECNRLFKRHIPEESEIRKDWKGGKIIQALVKLADPACFDKRVHSFNVKENMESLLKVIAFLAREGD